MSDPDPILEAYIRGGDLDDPGFDKAGRIHDWRNYVGEHVRARWETIPIELRAAIAADAQTLADREDWE
jgi:hypothetical protein